MQPVLQKVLVVGGNGFLGSAVCKVALARGIQVTSISSSGRPYQTPKGHSPAWTSKVDWQAADALKPDSYAHLLPEVNGVVHTLGTLLEDGLYKEKLKEGDLLGLVGSFVGDVVGSAGNPLESGEERKGSYEVMNRDAALRVCETFLTSPSSSKSTNPRPFIFISAEDIFRPVISERYITTKWEAERKIEEMMLGKADFREVFIRPSLIYHAHHRPLTSPLAALLDLSATLHAKVPPTLPTPSSVLKSLGTAFTSAAPLTSVANALTIPPIHVEHVAEAICVALDPARSDVRGVVDVRRMRELIGWAEKEESTTQDG